MNYHLSRKGENLGTFPLEEIRRRRASGELDGSEFVWQEGWNQWYPVDSALSLGGPHNPPPIKSGDRTQIAAIAIIFTVVLLAGGFVYLNVRGLMGKAFLGQSSYRSGRSLALVAASKPIKVGPDSRTEADTSQAAIEFYERQFLDGYKLRGEKNPVSDAIALKLIQDWITNGFVDNEPNSAASSLQEPGNELAALPSVDPLALTVAAANSSGLPGCIHRLQRAVDGFEKSGHLAYPKFYAAVLLGNKTYQDSDNSVPALDAKALKQFKLLLTDGSIRPDDQSQLGEQLVNGWGESFFKRNGSEVVGAVEAQGKSFHWLALTLRGEMEINLAWDARGDGDANSVSDEGWKGFSTHLNLARESLTEAWQLNPKEPLAPCRMMTVALGDGSITEMREWFDKTVAAQIDYPGAWKEMRWGLRPRWYGDYESMLAFGRTALKTHRFDTDVPRKYFDCLCDIEAEYDFSSTRRVFGRADVWPYLREMYEGYIAATTNDCRRDWQSTYAAAAYLAKSYSVAAKQLAAVNWQPDPGSLKNWDVDLSLMPQEVMARTDWCSNQVAEAEFQRTKGQPAAALKIYRDLDNKVDKQTRTFVLDRIATLDLETRLRAGEWVSFLPTDTNFTGWQVEMGDFHLQPDGSLVVHSGETGHMIYSHLQAGTSFEIRGRFDVLNSTSKAFQAGLVMGTPQFESWNWYGFRIKRTPEDGDLATFSQHWTKREITAPFQWDASTNTVFDFRYQNQVISAIVNGQTVFNQASPPENSYVSTNEFFVGLGAFNHGNSTTLRYHDVQLRLLPTDGKPDWNWLTH
ncbi:MAG TPA: GYF domain-containing protein [Candidatus Sulfotelmatobacter sp.]|jgi:hypothetical protein|nr:GYF domain-containing protein [Candidatus Sulfotelmatobacter sp.]